ncbi:MAG TPA: hypothetical protein VMU42_02515 [Candidatus Sulfotelmatobacter sp.]|nr:hypothetical protein [Candidatus Sulfotelmatobacter sp.]
MFVRLIRWCRVQFFGPPRAGRREDQSVLAWHVPRDFIQNDRRV